MTYQEMKQLNKAEISWYSFISGLCQYQNNQIEEIEVTGENFILIIVHLFNSKNHRHLTWKYRFHNDENILADIFLDKIRSEFPNVKISGAERSI